MKVAPRMAQTAESCYSINLYSEFCLGALNGESDAPKASRKIIVKISLAIP